MKTTHIVACSYAPGQNLVRTEPMNPKQQDSICARSMERTHIDPSLPPTLKEKVAPMKEETAETKKASNTMSSQIIHRPTPQYPSLSEQHSVKGP